MKKLFFALICTAIGFSASANNVTSKRDATTETKIEAAPTFKRNNSIETGRLSAEKLGFFRRQMNFTFTDACGKSYVVYVSGPSSASNYSLWETANIHFRGNVMADYWGCYRM
ncbi:hypothetical protein ASE92_03265 [Pedobacter sp. Leaf41]|uniref:hypothetical protein n=1 Tax=Pedobacter sp. Leaf41 TaxID=1736218 RepID=UPI0007039818|nr:hypothetical protein [Pedobacter sp. Leaf41]KQN38469.1 hypothetical protein ASE92_03265 [Pedobacter sp. Leaf41]